MNPNLESWFTTFEMPEKTANLVREQKEKKYVVQMLKQPSGKYILKYRGMTDMEKAEKSRQAKMNKNITN